jgi:Fe2+ transport system protein FeoA
MPRSASSAANFLFPLEVLRSGDWAEVAEVGGEPGWVARLAELGIRAGIRLQVLQPGSPCLLRVGGARLSLRAEQASQILVYLPS